MHIWVCRCNWIYVKDLSYVGFKGDGSMKNHGIHKDSMNEKWILPKACKTVVQCKCGCGKVPKSRKKSKQILFKTYQVFWCICLFIAKFYPTRGRWRHISQLFVAVEWRAVVTASPLGNYWINAETIEWHPHTNWVSLRINGGMRHLNPSFKPLAQCPTCSRGGGGYCEFRRRLEKVFYSEAWAHFTMPPYPPPLNLVVSNQYIPSCRWKKCNQSRDCEEISP